MSTTDLAQQVADLTTATTKLTEEVVGQKDRLTAAADTATGKATDASGSAQAAAQSVTDAAAEVTKATNQANTAGIEADRAKTEADRASEVSGLDTVEQAVDTAMAEFAGLMTESEARAIQWQNENVNFDASGFVHMGKSEAGSSYTTINEGLYVRNDAPSWANSVGFGVNSLTGNIGTSKTDQPQIHIAGSVGTLNLNTFGVANGVSQFQLPQAEDGTRIYDSTGDARGSGKASLDLKVDVDPKYGDVPTGTEEEILREAVGRAFEGAYAKNGDLRLGGSGWVDHTSSGRTTFATSGIAIVSGGSTCFVYNTTEIPLDAECEVSFTIASLTTGGVGVSFSDWADATRLTTLGRHTITGVNTTHKRIYLVCGPNDDVVVTNLSIKPVTEEVVTHPVDLVGLEYYEEELTGRQEIFECIQSLSTTFGTTSVPTVLSTRKLSYFQQYDGQFPEVTANPDFINDRYRCVVWDDLTEPQKREVAAYMGEKLFKGVNGHIVNGRLRARTIRGLGNGDWKNIDVTHSGNSFDQFLTFSKDSNAVRPQGIEDASEAFTSASSRAYATTPLQQSSNDLAYSGVFTLWNNKSYAYQGRCFFYVVASIPRANKGAYHPDLNPFGTRYEKSLTGDGGVKWYARGTIKTLMQCFIIRNFGDNQVGAYRYSGSIADGISGHPDGIYYDGITSGGLNGVIDWRLSAFEGDSPEEAAKVQAKVENKTYRGLEKLVWTKAIGSNVNVTNWNIASNSIVVDLGSDTWSSLGFSTGDVVELVEESTGLIRKGKVYGVASVLSLSPSQTEAGLPTGSKISLVASKSINLSVSGEFNTSMVIGDPANILQTDALKNGWLGTWCPVIPDGTNRLFPYSRKALEWGVGSYTTNNGTSWNTSGSKPMPVVENGYTLSESANLVYTINYKAFAKQTKPSTNKPVYNAKAGLMDVLEVMTNSTSYAALLSESFFGKILTSSAPKNVYSSAINKFLLDSAGKLSSHSDFPPEHTRLSLGAPNNNNQAFKALPYQISNNGQGSIGYQANELTYDADATNWGDDSTIKVTADGSDTFVDLNGNTNLSVVHELAIPYTWTSNHARAGVQVESVDL